MRGTDERRLLHPDIERGIRCRQNPSAVLSAPEDRGAGDNQTPAEKSVDRISSWMNNS